MKRIQSKAFRKLRGKLGRLSPRGQVGVAAVGILAVVAGGAYAYRTYHYVQHDNEFCTSCHIMVEPFEKFQQSAHAELSCKQCHHPTPIERARMALTQVVEHPEEVRVDAEVSTETCSGCHVDGDPEQWSLISNTAGHLVHLGSEDPVLKDIECVACHSVSVHEFAPTNETCGQSECHSEISVNLGEMGKAEMHCLACHEFTRPTDPRARAEGEDPRSELLRPSHRQCLGCHEMQELVAIAPIDEPHEGTCATCHDAHGQEASGDAWESCTTAGCHDRAERYPNSHHREPDISVEVCSNCHVAHEFRADEADCLSCHSEIMRPRQPISTRPTVTPGTPPVSGIVFVGFGFSPTPPTPLVGAPSGAAQDTVEFRHEQHQRLDCQECHRSGTGPIATSPRWCADCHHGESLARGCQSCHQSGPTEPIDRSMRLDLPGGTIERPVEFPHTEHADLACGECHEGGTTVSAADVECASCHVDHHESAGDCAACHRDPPQWAHGIPMVHQTCAGSLCHARYPLPETAEDWTRQRPVCVLCHENFAGENPLPDLPPWPAVEPVPGPIPEG